MSQPFSATAAIKQRHSVRTYEPRPLSADDRARLEAVIPTLTNPFGVDVRLHMADTDAATADGRRLGTYGVVKGARTFVGVSVPRVGKSLVAAGYVMETFILRATALGLGTVWLGGTFKRSRFAEAMGVAADDDFPAITPVGYPAARRRFLDTFMRGALRSATRRPWADLFFDADWDAPLTEAAAGPYAEALEMVRRAPSARNAQPWRVVKAGTDFHFFVQYPPKSDPAELPLKQVDMGIALAHFILTAEERGLGGILVSKSPAGPLANVPPGVRYVATFSPTV